MTNIAEDFSKPPVAPILVYFAPCIEALSEVDAVEMTSVIYVQVTLTWKDDRLIERDGPKWKFKKEPFGEKGSDQYESWRMGSNLKVWHPYTVLDKAREEKDEVGEGDEVTHVVGSGHFLSVQIIRDQRDEPHVSMRFVFNKKVQHDFHLKYFPFDSQLLIYRFAVNGQDAAEDAILVPHCPAHLVDAEKCQVSRADREHDGYDAMKVKLVPYVEEQEWARHIKQLGIGTESQMSSRQEHCGLPLCSVMEIRIAVRRSAEFFVWKIISINLLLMAMCPVVFAFATNSQGISDRFGVSLGLLLTAVALQYATNEYVPVLPYLTALDWLLLGMYAVFALAYFQNFAVLQTVDLRSTQGARADDYDQEDLDKMHDFADILDIVGGACYGVGFLCVVLRLLWDWRRGHCIPAEFDELPPGARMCLPQTNGFGFASDEIAKQRHGLVGKDAYAFVIPPQIEAALDPSPEDRRRCISSWPGCLCSSPPPRPGS